MAILKPDKTTTLGGVTVKEYLLTKHNPNHIDMPSVSMEGKIIGVTIHNTDWISVASGTTPAEQYTRATVNGNMLWGANRSKWVQKKTLTPKIRYFSPFLQ